MHVPQTEKMFLSEEMASFVADIRAAYVRDFQFAERRSDEANRGVTCGAGSQS
jgi:hypothetical protein